MATPVTRRISCASRSGGRWPRTSTRRAAPTSVDEERTARTSARGARPGRPSLILAARDDGVPAADPANRHRSHRAGVAGTLRSSNVHWSPSWLAAASQHRRHSIGRLDDRHAASGPAFGLSDLRLASPSTSFTDLQMVIHQEHFDSIVRQASKGPSFEEPRDSE